MRSVLCALSLGSGLALLVSNAGGFGASVPTLSDPPKNKKKNSLARSS